MPPGLFVPHGSFAHLLDHAPEDYVAARDGLDPDVGPHGSEVQLVAVGRDERLLAGPQ